MMTNGTGLPRQFPRRAAAYASRAANDVVIGEPADFAFHFPPSEEAAAARILAKPESSDPMPRNTSETPDDDQADVEYASGVRERMDFLVANGGEGSDHHVEAIEPGPAFDEVKAGGADERKPEQRHADKPKVAERFHGWSLALAVGRWPSTVAVITDQRSDSEL